MNSEHYSRGQHNQNIKITHMTPNNPKEIETENEIQMHAKEKLLIDKIQ